MIKYTSPHKTTKTSRDPEETVSMLLQLRDEIWEKVKNTPITGRNDILLRINECLFLPKK